jgi:hypothetical protein
MENKAPKSVLSMLGLTTQRQFRQMKRKQLKAVLKAWKKFRSGCAYCEGYPHNISEAGRYLERIIKDLSIKNWGR